MRILILMDLDASNDWTARTFTVEHALWSRHIINRDDQYTGRVSKDHGVAQWHWTGVLRRNTSVEMRGTLYLSVQVGWRYREVLLHDGRVERAFPEVDCSIMEGP